MTVVNGKLQNPAGLLPANASVVVVLVDYNDRPIIGFDVVSKREVMSSYLLSPSDDGSWSIDLTTNDSLQLSGGQAATAYRICETGFGAVETYWILVPASGPVDVVDIRTTLVGAVAPSPVANLAIQGGLTVGGTFTYRGTAMAAFTGNQFAFLAGDGTFRVPGGGPPTGSAGGDLFGSTYPNPTLAATANVLSIIDSQIPTALPPIGSAGGGLAGTYPNPVVAYLRGVQVGTAAPTSGQYLGAVSPTSAAWVTPATGGATGDAQTLKLGLCSQPVPLETINNTDLGMSSDFVIAELQPQLSQPAKSIVVMVGTAGSGPNGENKFALFEAATGNQVAITGDMSAAMSDPANNGKIVKGALTSTFTPDPNKKYIAAVLGHMGTDPRIAGLFSGSGIHLPTVEGNRSGMVLGSQATMPAVLDVVNALSAAAVYYIAVAPD